MNHLRRFGVVIGAVILAACAQAPPAAPPEPPDTRPADEAAIHAKVKDWSAAAQAKDPEKFTSFYTEDGVVMLANAPDVQGKAAIKDAIGGMMQDPSFALSFEAEKVVVARSGDLAYETGTYALTMTDPQKKQPSTERGHYVTVWRKLADGTWKVAVDTPVSDPAEGAAPAPAH